MNIKDRAKIQIEDMTHSGEGVGRIDNMTVFVEGSVPGDEVEIEITTIKKNYMVGKALEILQASDKRQTPPCAHFGQCGGCQILQMRYEDQLELKHKLVKDALERIGDFNEVTVNPVLGMANPVRYRNKAQYKINNKGIGFYAKKSHQIVPISDCLTQSESCTDVIKVFNQLLSEDMFDLYNEQKHKGLLRGIVQRTNQEGDNMIILVCNGKKLKNKEAIIERIVKDVPNVKSVYLNINWRQGNAILGEENILLFGSEHIEEKIGDLSFWISPNSFFQVNTTQTKVLYDCVKKMADLKEEEILFDLYCGTGSIGLYLADKAKKVYGIEVAETAIADARENAERNGIKNIDFIKGRSEIEGPKLVKDGKIPDVIVLDPPRKGCDVELLKMIEGINVKKLIYVSCNPSTLARDLKILAAQGYAIEEVQPVDLFAGSGHVECVCLMTRIK